MQEESLRISQVCRTEEICASFPRTQNWRKTSENYRKYVEGFQNRSNENLSRRMRENPTKTGFSRIDENEDLHISKLKFFYVAI